MECVRLTHVCDVRSDRLEFISNRYPDVVGSLDATTLIADQNIDAIVIATPPHTHHMLTLAALKAGKHVMVEKPLATCVQEGEELIETAAKMVRVLAVGHVFLYAPAVARMRSLLSEQRVGELYYISAVRTNVGPPAAHVDALWDLAPHDVSIILDIMKQPPAEVFAQGGSFTKSNLVETAFLVLRFGDGRLAHVHVGWLTPNKVRLMRLVCSHGEVVYDDMQPVQKLQVHNPAIDNRMLSNGASAQLNYGSGGTWSPALERYEPLRAECEDFIASIKSGKRALSDGQSGLEVVRVLETASQRLRNRGHSVMRSSQVTVSAATL